MASISVMYDLLCKREACGASRVQEGASNMPVCLSSYPVTEIINPSCKITKNKVYQLKFSSNLNRGIEFLSDTVTVCGWDKQWRNRAIFFI